MVNFKWVSSWYHQKQPPEVFCKKSVLRNFMKFTGCQGLFFNKVAPANLLKKRLWHRYFPVNFVKFLRTPFLTEHLRMTAFCIILHTILWSLLLVLNKLITLLYLVCMFGYMTFSISFIRKKFRELFSFIKD